VFTTFGFIFKNFWLMLRGKWFRFGYAAANFGEPLSLKEYLSLYGWKPKDLSREERIEHVQELAEELIEQIAGVIPVLPSSLVSSVILENPDTEFSATELQDKVETLSKQLQASHAHVYVPRNDPDYSFEVGLRMLTLRKMIIESDEENISERTYKLNHDYKDVVQYYANSIKYLVVRSQNELIA
jgi:glycerol-3-phosphate O-acyltransferase